MSEWEAALAATLILAALVNFGYWRAWAWLTAGAGSYILSSMYFHAGGPLFPLFALLCDATICVLIYFFSRTRWEVALFVVFNASVAVNAIQLLRGDADYAYHLLLELANWAALFIILGTGIARLVNVLVDRFGVTHGGRGIHRALHSLFAPASLPGRKRAE